MLDSNKIYEPPAVGRAIRSGATAGALTAVGFAVIHHIFISNIWFSLLVMMIAAAFCGSCISWSYVLLVKVPSISSWWMYNLLYVALLALLGVLSVLIFDPVTTIAALIAADGPPGMLIGQALPVTAIFTLLTAVLVSLLYGRTWRHFGVILLTCIVLVLFLGLNVSVIGLVAIPRGSLYLVIELFGLILAINVIFAALFMILERKRLFRNGRAGKLVTG